MRHKRIATIMIVGMVLAIFVVPALAQDPYDVMPKKSQDGTAVPDVDKNPANPNNPLPGDKSCWQACASNLLGAAGWGLAANTAQQNANAIYGHMTAHFGIANPGDPALAINWWLYNYGYNSDEDDNDWYRPELKYNDVTTRFGGILPGNAIHQYDCLLNELKRCQYIAVQISTEVGDHCLTFVGGDFSGKPNGQSIFHDSDRDMGTGPDGINDDVYANGFGPNWQLMNYSPQAPVTVTGYTMLCPGIQKADSAMRNYDAAYYMDQNLAGVVSKVWRTAGTNNYGIPGWVQDDQDKYTILHVENEEIPEKYKEVYLLVDFEKNVYNAANTPDIKLRAFDPEIAGAFKYYTASVTISPDGGQILYKWTLDDQPPFEEIIFPDETFYNLSGDVKDFNIATECVPEPATMSLLVLGGIALLIRRKRN